jgi:hypothetical protein
MCQHTYSLSWPEREFLVFWLQFSFGIIAVVLCFVTWYVIFIKNFTSVYAHLDTSEATKGASFLLLLYQQLLSELLRHISFPNLLLKCLDMTLAGFLLLVPFDGWSVFHHFIVHTLELLIYCFYWFRDVQDVFMVHMVHILNTDYYHTQH